MCHVRDLVDTVLDDKMFQIKLPASHSVLVAAADQGFTLLSPPRVYSHIHLGTG